MELNSIEPWLRTTIYEELSRVLKQGLECNRMGEFIWDFNSEKTLYISENMLDQVDVLENCLHLSDGTTTVKATCDFDCRKQFDKEAALTIGLPRDVTQIPIGALVQIKFSLCVNPGRKQRAKHVSLLVHRLIIQNVEPYINTRGTTPFYACPEFDELAEKLLKHSSHPKGLHQSLPNSDQDSGQQFATQAPAPRFNMQKSNEKSVGSCVVKETNANKRPSPDASPPLSQPAKPSKQDDTTAMARSKTALSDLYALKPKIKVTSTGKENIHQPKSGQIFMQHPVSSESSSIDQISDKQSSRNSSKISQDEPNVGQSQQSNLIVTRSSSSSSRANIHLEGYESDQGAQVKTYVTGKQDPSSKNLRDSVQLAYKTVSMPITQQINLRGVSSSSVSDAGQEEPIAKPSLQDPVQIPEVLLAKQQSPQSNQQIQADFHGAQRKPYSTDDSWARIRLKRCDFTIPSNQQKLLSNNIWLPAPTGQTHPTVNIPLEDLNAFTKHIDHPNSTGKSDSPEATFEGISSHTLQNVYQEELKESEVELKFQTPQKKELASSPVGSSKVEWSQSPTRLERPFLPNFSAPEQDEIPPDSSCLSSGQLTSSSPTVEQQKLPRDSSPRNQSAEAETPPTNRRRVSHREEKEPEQLPYNYKKHGSIPSIYDIPQSSDAEPDQEIKGHEDKFELKDREEDAIANMLSEAGSSPHKYRSTMYSKGPTQPNSCEESYHSKKNLVYQQTTSKTICFNKLPRSDIGMGSVNEVLITATPPGASGSSQHSDIKLDERPVIAAGQLKEDTAILDDDNDDSDAESLIETAPPMALDTPTAYENILDELNRPSTSESFQSTPAETRVGTVDVKETPLGQAKKNQAFPTSAITSSTMIPATYDCNKTGDERRDPIIPQSTDNAGAVIERSRKRPGTELPQKDGRKRGRLNVQALSQSFGSKEYSAEIKDPSVATKNWKREFVADAIARDEARRRDGIGLKQHKTTSKTPSSSIRSRSPHAVIGAGTLLSAENGVIRSRKRHVTEKAFPTARMAECSGSSSCVSSQNKGSVTSETADGATEHREHIDRSGPASPTLTEEHHSASGRSFPTTESTLFEKFKKAYPDYAGSETHFTTMADKIAQNNLLHPTLWDAYVVRHRKDYLPYVMDCFAEGMEDQMQPFDDFFNSIDDPQYHLRLLTRTNLSEVCTIPYPLSRSNSNRASLLPGNGFSLPSTPPRPSSRNHASIRAASPNPASIHHAAGSARSNSVASVSPIIIRRAREEDAFYQTMKRSLPPQLDSGDESPPRSRRKMPWSTKSASTSDLANTLQQTPYDRAHALTSNSSTPGLRKPPIRSTSISITPQLRQQTTAPEARSPGMPNSTQDTTTPRAPFRNLPTVPKRDFPSAAPQAVERSVLFKSSQKLVPSSAVAKSASIPRASSASRKRVSTPGWSKKIKDEDFFKQFRKT